MKKLLLVMFFLCLKSIQINANESIFNWPPTVIEVNVYDNIYDYINEIKNNINLKQGYYDDNFYIEYNHVNYSTLSTISTNILKTYTHYIKAVSPKYNYSEIKTFKFEVVDKEKPEILSVSDFLVVVGGSKPNYKALINAVDNYTKKEDLIIDIDDSNVNYLVVGTYYLIYTVTDLSNNYTNYVKEVKIVDNIPPTIKNTSSNIYSFGTEFNINNYFIVSDNYDEELVIDYYFSSPLNILGTTNIHLTVRDSSNNKSEAFKEIIVIDDTSPIIRSKENFLYLEVYSEQINVLDFIEIFDNYDTFESLEIIISSNINYEEVGEYNLNISVKDSSNNEQFLTLTVFVIDSTPPNVYGADLVINNNEIDLFEGLIISDNYSKEEELTLLIYQTNFQNEPGNYFIIYELKDKSNNVTYFKRDIVVLGGIKANNKVYLISGGAIFLSSAVVILLIYLRKRKNS